MKIETVMLQQQEYYVVNKIMKQGNEYYILVNTADNEDICVRKKVIENEEEYLIGLENEEEFNQVMKEYISNMR